MNFPVIALRGMTVLPRMVVHFDASREKSIAAAQKAMMTDQKVLVLMQKDSNISDPSEEDLCHIGTLVRIKQMMKMKGNTVRIMVEGLERAKLLSLEDQGEFLTGDIAFYPRKDINKELAYNEQEAMLRELKEHLQKFSDETGATRQGVPRLLEIRSLAALLEEFCMTLPFESDIRQEMLEAETYTDLYFYIENLIYKETEIEAIRKEFQQKVKERLDKSQKEYILREQLKVIHEELGEDNNETDAQNFENQLEQLEAKPEVKEKIQKEIKRFRSIPNGSQEGTVIRNYIETLLELPWDHVSEDNSDTIHAMEILERDHYGLKKVKERVIEYLAVRSVVQDSSAPILCLVGPPGTGKTSIAKSIAEALERKYVRICLGGVRDEAEIRGHRRTYIGAMPGRLAAALKQAGTGNPLMLLDEIDKVSSDYKGDTSSALLEVLDPEQNSKFRDHYLEIPLDLSKVLFIATANSTHTIPGPLLDRMEIIEVSSYTETEKYHIASQYLLPKQMKKNGLQKGQLTVGEKTLRKIIHNYTREAGVRNLERRIADICRKAVREILEKNKKSVRVTDANIEKFLGIEKVTFEQANKEDAVGIVRGLAWTSVGGDTLQIEVSVLPGKGKIQLTGQMGDVMQESARIAFSYARAAASKYDIDTEFFEKHDFHLHIPEGAVPKDGPSAGITMATAILSAVTNQKVFADLAMTGEVTLRGRVLPIGGLKEKLLAARMADIHHVLVPEKNKPNVMELDAEITKGLQIDFVTNMTEVIEQAFVK